MKTEFKRITVENLNRISKNKSIACVGCGKRFFEMIKIYYDESFIDKIYLTFDNNKMLWQHMIKINNKNVEVSSFEKIEQLDNKEWIIIITSDHYKEIYNQIRKYNSKIKIYIYPQIYYNITKMIIKVVNCLPLRRQILFYAGNEPHENADAIVEYLLNQYKDRKYEIVYIEDGKKLSSDGITHINKWSIRKKAQLKEIITFCKYYGFSRFICYENEPLEKMSSRQKLIYLNHGTIPIKNVKDVLKQPDNIDFGICAGKGCSYIYEQQYGIPVKKQKYMMPARVYKMLNSSVKIDSLVNTKDKEVILWLPTFRSLAGSNRKDSTNSDYLSILSENIEEIDKKLKLNNQILIIKKHPREKYKMNFLKSSQKEKNIKIITDEILDENEITLQDVLKNAKGLLTDYSSIAFEYMLLNRKIGYVISDIEEYNRGFAMENYKDYMPGIFIKTVDDLIDFFDEVCKEKDNYELKRKKLVSELFGESAYKNGAQQFIEFLDGLE